MLCSKTAAIPQTFPKLGWTDEQLIGFNICTRPNSHLSWYEMSNAFNDRGFDHRRASEFIHVVQTGYGNFGNGRADSKEVHCIDISIKLRS